MAVEWSHAAGWEAERTFLVEVRPDDEAPDKFCKVTVSTTTATGLHSRTIKTHKTIMTAGPAVLCKMDCNQWLYVGNTVSVFTPEAEITGFFYNNDGTNAWPWAVDRLGNAYDLYGEEIRPRTIPATEPHETTAARDPDLIFGSLAAVDLPMYRMPLFRIVE